MVGQFKIGNVGNRDSTAITEEPLRHSPTQRNFRLYYVQQWDKQFCENIQRIIRAVNVRTYSKKPWNFQKLAKLQLICGPESINVLTLFNKAYHLQMFFDVGWNERNMIWTENARIWLNGNHQRQEAFFYSCNSSEGSRKQRRNPARSSPNFI